MSSESLGTPRPVCISRVDVSAVHLGIAHKAASTSSTTHSLTEKLPQQHQFKNLHHFLLHVKWVLNQALPLMTKKTRIHSKMCLQTI